LSEKIKIVAANDVGAPLQERLEERLEDLVGYHLRRVSLIDMNGFIDHFADENLRPVPFSILCLIDERPGLSAADIGRMLNLQRANLVHLLADLDEDNLIERRSEEGDKRKQSLFLTAHGAGKLADWRRRVRDHENHLLRRLTAAERASLLRILAKIWTSEDR
jgi:DNA-binding MarR family transcriptional regulator